MEAALGVSYPTVKSHLASIKEKLNPTGRNTGIQPEADDSSAQDEPTEQNPEVAPEPSVTILEDLEQGRISYKDALKMIKNQKKGKSNADHH